MKRGIALRDMCCMCRGSGETMDHLLLHYDIAYTFWTFVFSMFGVQRIMQRSVVDHYLDRGIGLANTLLLFGI